MLNGPTLPEVERVAPGRVEQRRIPGRRRVGWVAGDRAGGDAGSVLVLMPAAVLVVLLLGAIAVDLAVVHLRQRQAVAAAASAANDAVTAGLDQTALRRGEGYRLDPDLVDRVVTESIGAQDLGGRLVDVRATIVEPDSVTVVVRLRAEELFARALPDGDRTTVVQGLATATARPR